MVTRPDDRPARGGGEVHRDFTAPWGLNGGDSLLSLTQDARRRPAPTRSNVSNQYPPPSDYTYGPVRPEWGPPTQPEPTQVLPAWPGAWGPPPPPPPPARPPRRQRTGLIATIAAIAGLALGYQAAALPGMLGPILGAPNAPTTQAPADEPVRPGGRDGDSGGVALDPTAPDGSVTDAFAAGVVLIETQTQGGTGAGTGMVLTPEGRVLTNYHVVEATSRIRVTVAESGDTYDATLLGHDASRDVALLQLDRASGLDTVRADDEEVAIGDTVTAVGNSNGQGFIDAATGRITSLSETISVADSTWGGSRQLVGALESSARAVPGDSGGPMFDAEAEVVGMTTAGSSSNDSRRSATSYAVPIDDALAIAEQISAGRQSGSIRVGPKAYLGITVVAAEGATTGVGVNSVVEGGPADTAGIEAGDTLVRVDGQRLTNRASLASALGELDPDEQVRVTWVDDGGRERTATVTLGTNPLN